MKQKISFQIELPYSKKRVQSWLNAFPIGPQGKSQLLDGPSHSTIVHEWIDDFGRYSKEAAEKSLRDRHTQMKYDLQVIDRYPMRPLKIAIAGCSGLIGSRLEAFLLAGGHQVTPIVRQKNRSGIYWNPSLHEIESEKLEGIDVIINLAGENIGEGRWSSEKMQAILESRVFAAETLKKGVASLKCPPELYLSASAIGYYAPSESPIDENAPKGEHFLSKVVELWERAAKQMNVRRQVFMRFGVVLSNRGGALKELILPFKLGLGARVGSKNQYMSWITIDDLIYNCYHTIHTHSLKGAVNFVAPEATTMEQLAATIGNELKKPNLLAIPDLPLKLLLGSQKAQEMLLVSHHIKPEKLLSSSAFFYYPTLQEALSHLI